MIVALLGRAASGKTTLGRRLQEHFDLPLLGPDSVRKGRGQPRAQVWRALLEQVDAHEDCIIESCLVPAPYARRLHEEHSLIVHVCAHPRVRADRLRARGWNAKRIHKDRHYPISFPASEVVVDTTRGLTDEQVAEVSACVSRRNASSASASEVREGSN